MAEAIGEARPRGVQHLLNDACWDANAVRDDLREWLEERGRPQAVMVPKTNAVGIGDAGKIEH